MKKEKCRRKRNKIADCAGTDVGVVEAVLVSYACMRYSVDSR